MMQLKPLAVAITSALALSSGFASADEAMNEGGFFISANIPAIVFDSELDLNAAMGGGFGFGMFYEKAGFEINGSQVSSETDFTFADVDATWYSADFLYHFDGANVASPYLRVGYGNIEYEADFAETDEDFAKLAFGYQHWFSENISFRLEAFAMKGLDSDLEYENYGLQLFFSYLFGASQPEPAPVVVLDSDNDSVPNDRDQCPNSPAGSQVNSSGCPIDSDMDGVVDSNDRCPNTLKDVTVDELGCAKDSDKDGVVDSFDKCPNTPSGAKVDPQGCEEKLKETVSITMNVEFDSGSANLRSSSVSEVERVAEFLRQYPSTKVVIEGHTDASGDANFNMRLSEQRAQSVMNELVSSYGIDASRLSAVGYGESQPIADNNTREGRQKNRRVVATVQALK